MRSIGDVWRYPRREFLEDGSQLRFSRRLDGWLSNILVASGHEMDDTFFEGFRGSGMAWQKYYDENHGWSEIHPPVEDSFQPHEWLINTNGRIYTQQGNVIWVHKPETDEDRAINERTKMLGKHAAYLDGEAQPGTKELALPPAA